ncbi:MAG TPA: hypothetical protein VK711_07515 [Puia sp.]|nr:hypothetical protein [Puia sp.]
MNIIFLILGMNVLFIFFFQRPWLLNMKPYLILLSINLLLFILAYLFHHYSIGDPRFTVLLKVPFLYQLSFLALLWIYRKLYHADPVDTFWSMDIKLMKDGIFNFIFVVLLSVVVICVS